MGTLVSACGIECDACPFFEKTCQGCREVMGRPFWVQEHLEGNPCPIFHCSVNEKALASCAQCAELPCKKFTDLKDPNASEEEHRKGIEKRVAVLKGTIS